MCFLYHPQVLVGFAVLIQPGSLLQIISAFIIVLVYMLLIGIAQPFKDVGDVTTPHVGRGGKVACPQTAAPVVAQVPKKKRKKEKTDCVLYHTMDKKIRINSKAKKDKRDVDNRFSVLFYLMDKDYVISATNTWREWLSMARTDLAFLSRARECAASPPSASPVEPRARLTVVSAPLGVEACHRITSCPFQSTAAAGQRVSSTFSKGGTRW